MVADQGHCAMDTVRPAHEADLPELVALYNHYVVNTAITFDTEPWTVAARRPWFDQFADAGRHRLLVLEHGGEIAGYACSTALKPKRAYETSVETTIYLAPEAGGGGLGTRLYGALIEALQGEDVHRAYGAIALPNPASIRLHEKLGFRALMVLSEVGRKFGRYHDVQWFERAIG